MADFNEIQEILSYRVLTQKYEEWGRKNVTPNPLYDFYVGKTTPEQVPADLVEYIVINAIRKAAPVNYRDQPARMMQPTGKQVRRIILMRLFNEIQLGMGALQMLRNPEQWSLQRMGKEEIQQQLEDLGTQHMITKHLSFAKLFTAGAIYLDSAGNIIETAANAMTTIGEGIPAANTGQIAQSNFFPNGVGNIISTKWSDPSALILDQLDVLTDAAQRNRQPPPRHVWLFRPNKKWIRNNLQIQKLFQFQTGSERLDNALKDDSFEINNYMFHFMGTTYQPFSGPPDNPYIPANMAIITPEINENGNNWFANFEGMEYVPNTVNIVRDSTIENTANVQQGFDEVYGEFAYSKFNHNPPSAELFVGCNYFYALKQPNVVFTPTVDF